MSSWIQNRRLGGLLVALALCVILPGCGESKVTKANADKISKGMSDKEVSAILGPPSESGEVNVPDVGGLGAAAGIDMPGMPKMPKGMKNSIWKDGKKVITVSFMDNKVFTVLTAGF